jgi:hypothetical protein
MSEQALKEIFGDDVVEDQAEQAEVVEQEVEESGKGLKHMSLDEWTASGRDPSEWKTPEEFEEEGRRIKYQRPLRKELARQAEEFNRRLENVNKLHRAQLEQERNKLLLERDNAIDIADKAEVRRIDQALEKNKELQSAVAEQPVKPTEVAEWEAENPWIFDETDPRTAPAIKAFAEAQAAGKTLAMCILASDRAAAKVNVEEPKVKRTPTASADAPKARQVSGGKVQLSMKDLTAEERTFRSFYSSDAEFLKAVADSRS